MKTNHPQPGSVAASRVEMTQVVLPQFTNTVGTMFGGQVISWIDICAAVSSQRHCKSAVVTASIDSVHFLEPIKQGYVVVLQSFVNAVFRTSMEVGVTVYAEHPITSLRIKAIHAYCTFVSIDAQGKPQLVPELILETEGDRRENAAAKARRSLRLQARQLVLKEENEESVSGSH